MSPPPPHVRPSVSAVLVSREDEFSSRLSSRAGFRGCSALHYATLADDPHIVRMLLEAGRSPPHPHPRPAPVSTLDHTFMPHKFNKANRRLRDQRQTARNFNM